MTSTYGYRTSTELENFTATDYSVIDARYTSTVLDAWISQAELLVNKLKGTSYTGTIPDDVKAGTMEIAKRIAHNQLVDDGYLKSSESPKQKLIDDEILSILNILDNDFYCSAYGKDDSEV